MPPRRPDGTDWPAIAIVTASFNQGRFLEETIRSIVLQGYPALHYAVIDGASGDDSRAIIEKYAPWLDFWISEPDRGQAHAINKGIGGAHGDIFNFINSDDFLLPGALASIGASWRPGWGVASPIIHFQDHDRNLTRVMTNVGLTAEGLIVGGPGHRFQQPGFWFDLAALRATGPFDESFRYVFDWELAIRHLAAYPHVAYTDAATAMFRHHGAAKTTATGNQFVVERWRALRKISALPQYAALRPACRRRLARMAWPTFVRTLGNWAASTMARRR